MDKVKKALQKLSAKERQRIKRILLKITKGQMQRVDIRKLKGRNDIFRVRSGGLRIIFRRDKGGIFILTIARRNEKTYKFR